MVENETNRIREFCLCSHVAQTHSGDLFLVAEFIRHYTLQRIPPEHIFLRRSLHGCIVMVVDCPLMLDCLGDVKYLQLFQWLELLYLFCILLFEQLDQVHSGSFAIICSAPEVVLEGVHFADFVVCSQLVLRRLWHHFQLLVRPACQLVLVLKLLRHGGNEFLPINVFVLLVLLVVDNLLAVDELADIIA